MMSKKHFVRMADEFSEAMLDYAGMTHTQDCIGRLARAFADMAKADNGAFDRQRFYRACGLTNEGRAK